MRIARPDGGILSYTSCLPRMESVYTWMDGCTSTSLQLESLCHYGGRRSVDISLDVMSELRAMLTGSFRTNAAQSSVICECSVSWKMKRHPLGCGFLSRA